MTTGRIFQFGKFQIDALARTLRREETIVKLNSRAFDVLLCLVQNPGKILTREELLKSVWQDAFVDDSSVPQSISLLRRALEEKPGDNSYIVTLPGRGYQFASEVQVVSPEIGASDDGDTLPDVSTAARGNSGGFIFQKHTVETSVITTNEKREQLSSPTARSRPLMRAVAVGTVLALLAGGYFYTRRGPKLTEKDTIVLSDFSNKTGDPIFDDTLNTALDVSLRQSPFLNVLSDSKVTETLQLMTRPAGTKLTPEVARDLCQRAGSKAYIAGAIGSLGSEYVVSLKAVNCQNGDLLAQEQVTAASKEKALGALGEAASKLRSELGESLATVQQFDVPLSRATTSSLAALKAYSLGIKVFNQTGDAEALRHYQRAIELDPNFAMAYRAVGGVYGNLNEQERAREYLAKAFQLREHASEREKLTITADYYEYVTGQLDKASQAFQEKIESYPRDPLGYNDLALLFSAQGQYEKAVETARQGIRLAPGAKQFYNNLAWIYPCMQRFDETRQIIHEAQQRNFDADIFHQDLYAFAFLEADSAAMAQQLQWFAGKPDYEMEGIALASATEAYGGHLGKARGLTKQAVGSALRVDNKESGAGYLADAAVQEAAYGNVVKARQAAAEALKLAPASQGVEVEAALAFAMVGSADRAESLARDLNKRFPLDTQMQSLWLPAIQARVALTRANPGAVQALSPIEFGAGASSNSCLYHVYLRGEAYLAAGQGTAAAAEFQKILDHSGLVWNCWTGALAHLGLGRANILQARTSQGADADAARVRALAAYKDFLTLWKDADPDIPILKQANAEYSKVQ